MMEELGARAPPFVASKSKSGIKTLGPLESPHSGHSNDANVLILILHFDARSKGAPNSPYYRGGAQFPRLKSVHFKIYKMESTSVVCRVVML